MKRDQFLKPYKPRFVKRDPTKKHMKMIMEAYENNMTISIPGLCEATIRTSKYANVLKNEFVKSSKTMNKNLTIVQLLKNLDKIFESYYVKFSFNAEDPEEKEEFCGISKMGTNDKTIIVLCNNNFDIKFYKHDEELFQTFYELIAHELVHKGQLLLRSYKASTSIIHKYRRDVLKIHSNSNIDNAEKERLGMKYYLSQSEEIMAYANQILEELRFSGLDNKQVIEKLRSLKIESDLSSGMKMYNDYFSVSNKDDLVVIRRLFKYIYEYITGEEKHVFGIDLF